MIAMMSIRCRDCPRCSGVTEENEDRKHCLLCGWVNYKDPVSGRRKARRAVIKNNSLGEVVVPYYGGYKRFAGIDAKVKITVANRKNGAEGFLYKMNCPYKECGESVLPEKHRHCRKDIPARYVCTENHVWYLVIENNQPSFWR